MDPNTLQVWLTPNKSLRSKSQILTEDWGTEDSLRISQMQREQDDAPTPPPETWTTLKLPYQAPSCPPLPSWEQIRTATADHCLHARNGAHDVCRINNTVVKCSSSPSIIDEAENLLFLAEKRPELHIPTVLAVWTILADNKFRTHEKIPVHCLMMDFIDGFPLESEQLAELPIEAQDRIFAKVSAQIQYLRSLPSEGYYGRVHRQGWVDPPPGIRASTGVVKTVSGPYNTYEEFTSAIHSTFESEKATAGVGKEWWPKFPACAVELLSIFPGWKPHEPKFTWIDPKPTNIIARPIKDDAGNEDWEVFLIDWECAGWYPAWMQSMQFHKRCGAMIYDRSQPPDIYGLYPLIPYRREEILTHMLRDFDPIPDSERLAKVRKHDYWFF